MVQHVFTLMAPDDLLRPQALSWSGKESPHPKSLGRQGIVSWLARPYAGV